MKKILLLLGMVMLPGLAFAQSVSTGNVPQRITPTTCSATTIVTGGTFIVANNANTAPNGILIANPSTATEPLFFSFVQNATLTAGSTIFTLAAGASMQFPGTTTALTANATTSGHLFNCMRW